MAEDGDEGVDADAAGYQDEAGDVFGGDCKDGGRVGERAADADGQRCVED